MQFGYMDIPPGQLPLKPWKTYTFHVIPDLHDISSVFFVSLVF